MNRNGTLIKALGFLLGGIMIALAFTLTPGTYSLYRKEFNSPTSEVQAAETRDFIKEMEIEYKRGAPYLKLTQADNMDYAPVIFFSIEGPIKDYVLHINPVRLDGEIKIPIVPNVNLTQAISLITSGENHIKGNIKIKHLNEFINETHEVIITKEYLLERYFLNNGLKNFKISSLSSGEKAEMEKLVGKMISHTSPYMDWDKVVWQEAGNSNSMERSQSKVLPIGKANISSNQTSMIDLIAPDLLKYNEKLYSILEVLVKDFNSQMDENNLLKDEKQKLLDEVKNLEKIVDEFRGDIVELDNKIFLLEKDNKNLDNRIRDLKSDNDKLYDEIRYLEMDNKELQNVRRDFGINNGGLYNHIRYLEEKAREGVNNFVPVEDEKREENLGTVGE